mgnify:CR=1 FL=1
MKGKSVFRLFYWLLLIVAPSVAFLSYLSNRNSYPDLVNDGVADIQQYDLNGDHIIPLRGTFTFFPHKLLTPNEVLSQRSTGLPMSVPSFWSESDIMSRYGYGTYHTRIVMRNAPEYLGLYYDGVFTCASMFIDGKLVSTVGQVDSDPKNCIPDVESALVMFEPESDTIDLVIQVANYDFRSGGVNGEILLGESRKLNFLLSFRMILKGFLLGGLIIIALFQLGNALLPRSSYIYFIFAAICAILAVRVLILKGSPLYLLYDFSYIFKLRVEYMTLFLGVPMISAIMHGFFPKDYRKGFVFVFAGFGIVFSLVQFLLSPANNSWLIPPFQVITLIQGVLITFYLFVVVLNKRPDAYVFLIGWVMVLFGLVHDILETSGVLDNGIQLTPYLMFLFIFVQANILARRSSMAFVQVEELSARLNFVNQNLEKMVAERTHRIEKQNSELEKQSRKIDKQNRELQKTVDSRNLVLTVIGHDLRGPIGNISEMIDLLLSADIDGETQQQILSAIRQSATSSFTLLENLMYWGRAQSGKISYNPDLYSVREIAGEALNLLESAAKEKNITLENFIPPDQMAWCDFSHVNLIIRNLVNNSIKFTDSGGHIIVSSRVRNNPQNKQKYLEVLVRDDGIGIPPEKLEMIFSSEKVETTWGTNNEKGSGIGLPLVKEFVSINKGQIYARSKVGEFTTFFFTLPVKQ